jgi:poly(3-hydroxybutyrate) depolymerase
MLLVAPLSGHFATLLRGTVTSLLPHFDIFITSWKNARNVPLALGDFDLNSYVDYIISFCKTLNAKTHIMAICQPTVPVMIANVIMEENKEPFSPLSTILVAGPIDARINPTAVNTLASQHSIEWFNQRFISVVPLNYPGYLRHVYPGYLQLFNFMAMNPQNHLSAHQQMFADIIAGNEKDAHKRRTFYKEYKTVMDLTASFFLQTTEAVFQKFQLPLGNFQHHGQNINLKTIKNTHILAIEGEKDDICGIGQTKAALELTQSLPSSKKQYFLLKDAGHYGVFNGKKFNDLILPQLLSFTKNAEKNT